MEARVADTNMAEFHTKWKWPQDWSTDGSKTCRSKFHNDVKMAWARNKPPKAWNWNSVKYLKQIVQIKLLLKTCSQDGVYMIYQKVTKLFIFYVSDLFVLRGRSAGLPRIYFFYFWLLGIGGGGSWVWSHFELWRTRERVVRTLSAQHLHTCHPWHNCYIFLYFCTLATQVATVPTVLSVPHLLKLNRNCLI